MNVRSLVKKLVNAPLAPFGLHIARVANPVRKSWRVSQNYELRHSIAYMTQPFFQGVYATFKSGAMKASLGHRENVMLMPEYFANSEQEFGAFLHHITGKKCLDIGPNVWSFLAAWDVAGPRYVIEPLLEPIVAWQREHLGRSMYDGLIGITSPAEKVVPELVGAIDGAIICRNVLDHTPQWPFILSNISAYAAPGCKLILWTDLDHQGHADEGHYDITTDLEAFKGLVAQLGFRVIREHIWRKDEANWGCLAEKVFE